MFLEPPVKGQGGWYPPVFNLTFMGPFKGFKAGLPYQVPYELVGWYLNALDTYIVDLSFGAGTSFLCSNGKRKTQIQLWLPGQKDSPMYDYHCRLLLLCRLPDVGVLSLWFFEDELRCFLQYQRSIEKTPMAMGPNSP